LCEKGRAREFESEEVGLLYKMKNFEKTE
jgi:hypothetical protein